MTSAGETPTGIGINLNTQDTNFESFIDSDQMLDTTSSAPPTPKGKANRREAQKQKQLSSSALPTRLSEAKQAVGGQDLPHSPTVSDYLHFPRDAPSADVTTPTTASNSSSLHNLNFDFFDGDHSSVPGHGSTEISGPTTSSEGQVSASFGDHTMQTTPTETSSSTVPSADVFSWNSSNAFFPIPMAHSLTRSSDDADCGMDSRHLSQNNPHHHHHQRSLSLREVAPPSLADGEMASSLTTLPFPSVKMEAQEDDLSGPYAAENMPSPITEDRSSPASSSAICSSLFEMTSPRQEKKRRLASPSESVTSVASSKIGKQSHAGSTGNSRRSVSGSSTRKRKSSTSTAKGTVAGSASTTLSGAVPLDKTIAGTAMDQDQIDNDREVKVTGPTITAVQDSSISESKKEQLVSKASNGATTPEGPVAPTAPSKPGNKRPPPSASQITESGQPFPVIDTSAKHSSLFVPPDTSGLTKREARLVKNRAAAFLSRQRKREQFEELEIKCKSLCRLVWRFWEIVAGPNHEVPFAEKFSQTKILPIVLEEELEDVKEVLEMVVALKGGSVAPTEDGQVQGAVAAGIKSANGKIIGSALTTAATKTMSASSSSFSSSSSRANVAQDGEMKRLRAELEESKKREASLQAELNREKALRAGHDHNKSYHEEQGIRPFKGGKVGGSISLTIPPSFGEENEEDDQFRINSSNRRRGNRSRMTPSRTSERILRQHSSNLALTPVHSAANGGQRKAAGAALMMVLFSFALFGLPSGQTPRVGGITQVGSAEDFSVGRVLGAPTSLSQYSRDEEEETGEFDLKQTPSSHLSAKDLLPSTSDPSDIFNFEDLHATVSTPRLEKMQHTFQEVLRSSSGGDGDAGVGDEGIIDYRAFARDLGASLDWDVERGFLVIGSDHEQEGEDDHETNVSKPKEAKSGSDDKASDAPTKLTLFVPAPDVTSDLDVAEDRFYDAPLATADVSAGGDSPEGRVNDLNEIGSATSREMTQVEATKAALRVLRNHRLAQEAAALATSRRLRKKSSPSQSISSASPIAKRRATLGYQHTFVSPGQSGQFADEIRHDGDEKMELEDDEHQDFSKEVMDEASSTTDKIRGTDFYQLEFSLSGAKVRNVAELAKLFGVVRSKRE